MLQVVRSLQLTPHPNVEQLLLLGSDEAHPQLIKLANLNFQAAAQNTNIKHNKTQACNMFLSFFPGPFGPFTKLGVF